MSTVECWNIVSTSVSVTMRKFKVRLIPRGVKSILFRRQTTDTSWPSFEFVEIRHQYRHNDFVFFLEDFETNIVFPGGRNQRVLPRCAWGGFKIRSGFGAQPAQCVARRQDTSYPTQWWNCEEIRKYIELHWASFTLKVKVWATLGLSLEMLRPIELTFWKLPPSECQAPLIILHRYIVNLGP